MPERHPGIGVALLLAGLLLAAACWFDVGSAGAAAWLAQVPMALGIACLRGTRKRARLLADAGSLALLWAGGFALAGVLVALPVSAVLLVALRRVQAGYLGSDLFTGGPLKSPPPPPVAAPERGADGPPPSP